MCGAPDTMTHSVYLSILNKETGVKKDINELYVEL